VSPPPAIVDSPEMPLSATPMTGISNPMKNASEIPAKFLIALTPPAIEQEPTWLFRRRLSEMATRREWRCSSWPLIGKSLPDRGLLVPKKKKPDTDIWIILEHDTALAKTVKFDSNTPLDARTMRSYFTSVRFRVLK
jgi:hypothetical protein